jgi:hypothetical protein
MRYLGQVVQVETKVVGPSACLSSPVLDDLEILGLADLLGIYKRLPDDCKHCAQHFAADGLEGPVLARRRDDSSPAAGRASLRHGDLSQTSLHLTSLVLGTDYVKREVFEGAYADSPARRLRTVLAGIFVVHGRGRN